MAEDDAILSDDALLDLLCVEEDRVSRAAVDDILRRASSLRPRLVKLVDDHDLWHSHDWAPVHATFLLTAMKGPGALEAVLRALDMAEEHDHPYVIDVADSLLAAFGPEAVPTLLAAHPDASTYVKIWINDGLSHIADAHPAARDAVHDHLRKIALGDDDEEICACAALVFLPLVTAADREALEILVDRKLIEDGEMETALTNPEELALSKPVDWLSFYSPEEIERRQEGGADSDEDEEDSDLDGALPDSASLDVLSRLDAPPGPVPILNAAPKIGRNDPCPCGSGKKYKKCCGG